MMKDKVGRMHPRNKRSNAPPLLLRPAETARMLGLSPRQLHRMACKAAAGEAPGFPRALVLPGMSDRRYRREDVERYITELTDGGV